MRRCRCATSDAASPSPYGNRKWTCWFKLMMCIDQHWFEHFVNSALCRLGVQNDIILRVANRIISSCNPIISCHIFTISVRASQFTHTETQQHTTPFDGNDEWQSAVKYIAIVVGNKSSWCASLPIRISNEYKNKKCNQRQEQQAQSALKMQFFSETFRFSANWWVGKMI